MPASTQLYQHPHLWLLTDPGNPQSLLWLLIGVPMAPDQSTCKLELAQGLSHRRKPGTSTSCLFPNYQLWRRTLTEAHAPNSVSPITSTHPLVHPAARKKVKTRSFICVSVETVSYFISQAYNSLGHWPKSA